MIEIQLFDVVSPMGSMSVSPALIAGGLILLVAGFIAIRTVRKNKSLQKEMKINNEMKESVRKDEY